MGRTIDNFQTKMEAMSEAGTIPEDDPSDLMIDEWEKSCNEVDSEIEQEVVEQEASEDSDSDGSLRGSAYDDDEFQEYEDWDDAGGVYQDGGEAYDNFDWNALD